MREHISKIPQRRPDSHKGDYGRVLVVAGSIGKTGAAFLASQGALFAGSGLVTCAVPESLNEIMEIKLTEVMTLPLAETGDKSLSLKAEEGILDFSRDCDVVIIGPGLGKNAETRILVKELIKLIECPIVLDADGINAIEGQLDVFKKRKTKKTILTPHPGEMARLLGKKIDDVQKDRLNIAKEAARLTGSIVCLKGHRTIVADPDGVAYTNETGNSGMATGGTGDVLTGMIGSFIGQGVDDFSAAVAAVYLHGLAGDIAAEKKGQFAMVATDLLTYLPEAFKRSGI